MKKTILKTSVAAVLLASVPVANAAVNSFNYTGAFTMIDSAGIILANTSATAKDAGRFQTPISGTMQFDTVTGSGTGTVVPFSFNNGATLATAVGMKMQAIGDGAGGAGTLVMGNMLFDWNLNVGIPVSIVLDAAGFFANELTMGGANSAAPGSDGTYLAVANTPNNVDVNGYANVGGVPIATTEFNTSNINGCVYDTGCMTNDSSGGLPLITDTATNTAFQDTPNYPNADGVGISGSPFQAGPFIDFSPNFDVYNMTFTGSDAGSTIAANCTFVSGDLCPTVAAVPVPAAVWLFGSGLLGLVGVARRKKA